MDGHANLDDVALITLATQGHPEAFGVFFRRHANAVYNCLFRRTASWSEAEDLTSLVFLEAWRRREHLSGMDGSLIAWLLGVATNVLRTHRRAARRHQAALARLDSYRIEAVQPDFTDEVTERRLGDETKMRSILGVFSRMGRKDQEVLALCVWQGLSYEEAAIALGIPVGTVRSRLSRARTRLRADFLAIEPPISSVEGVTR